MNLFMVLESMTFWHWLTLGCALLVAEILGTAGYLLWLGISALLVGAGLAIYPFSWQIQWVSFAILSLLTTLLWWRRQSLLDEASDQISGLNQKHNQLIGMVVTLDEDVVVGMNRIKVADSTWSAQSNEALSAGTQVEIIAMDGIVLKIRQKT